MIYSGKKDVPFLDNIPIDVAEDLRDAREVLRNLAGAIEFSAPCESVMILTRRPKQSFALSGYLTTCLPSRVSRSPVAVLSCALGRGGL